MLRADVATCGLIAHLVGPVWRAVDLPLSSAAMRHSLRRTIDSRLGLGLFSTLLLVLAATGCKCSDDQPAPNPALSSASSAPPVRLPPLAGSIWTNLEEGASGEGTKMAGPLGVWVPVGAEKPRPIVVVLGGLDGAEPSASLVPAQLFDRLKHDVFVIAVGGPPSAAAPMLRSTLSRLKARYGAHVAPGSVLLVATGAYAGEAVSLLKEEPKFFARALLFDFDPTLWSSTTSYVLGQRGAQRVLLTTSEEQRRAGLQHAATITQRAGTPARALFVAAAAKAPELSVSAEVLTAGLAELPWLLSGAERFPVLPPAPLAPAQPAGSSAPSASGSSVATAPASSNAPAPSTPKKAERLAPAPSAAAPAPPVSPAKLPATRSVNDPGPLAPH